MANMQITKIVLNGSKWPGDPVPGLGYPTRTPACGSNGKGWDNTIDNFGSADDTQRALNASPAVGARVPMGQKRQMYYDSTENPGSYTMMYLAFHSYEDGMDISKDFSDGLFWCAPVSAGCISTSEWADTSKGPYFVVGRCTTGTDATKGAPLAIPCSTHIFSDGTVVNANGYGDGCGWFLIDGVIPAKDITLLDDETGAGKGVEITCQCGRGPFIVEITGDQPILMPADISNVTDATGAVGLSPESIVGGWCCGSAA